LNLHIPLNIGIDWGLDWLAVEARVHLLFDPGSVDEVAIIDFVALERPSHPFELFANHAFRIEARQLDGDPVVRFERPYRLSVGYADNEWQAGGIARETDLNLYSWNGLNWVPTLPCANCQLDTAANVLSVELDHLTEFALGVHRGTSAPPVTITLNPIADSYILSSTPTINYGMAPALYAGTQNAATIGRALFGFDLSAIPQGATVLSAIFQAFLVNGSPTPTMLDVELKRINVPWLEGTVTWNSPLTYTGATNITQVGTALNYYSWDVTSLAQTWVQGSPNYGVALISRNESNVGWRGFASKEDTLQPPRLPRLAVTYRR
jgi:hypothetical protein